jgi:hypothetical protein
MVLFMSTDYSFKPEQAVELRKLISAIQSGRRVVVEITDDSCLAGCDGYLENGMRAVIESATLHETDGEDEVYLFTLDFSEYVAFNRGKESAEYDTPVGLFTASLSGNVPSDLKESLYFSITHSESFFKVIESSHIDFYAEFVASGEKEYLSWLEAELAKARSMPNPYAGISVGRVQQPALKMFLKNDNE